MRLRWWRAGRPDSDGGSPDRRWVGDLLLWAAVSAPVAYAGVTPPYPRYAVPLLIGALSLLALAVTLGRRVPLTALVAVVLGSLLDGNFVFAIPVFSYLAGRRGTGTARAAAVFGGIAAGGSVLNLGLLGTEPATWFLLASVLLFAGVFPWLLGRHRRQQWALARAERRHAEAEERERRSAVDRIRLRERARIAQEMHDSLGHDLSLVALRAAALEVAPDLAPAHRAAAGELRASVAAVTERLREIIGVLRDERPGSLRPAGETVAELVDGARDAGLAVALRTAGDVDALPPLAAHTVHRLVREALTNAARYAPGAPVTVTVTRTGGEVAVGVVNGAPPAGPLPGPASPGTGLLALRERVRLAGGTLDAGPHQGGFAVTARLPLAADAADGPDTRPVPAAAPGRADAGPAAADGGAGLIGEPDGGLDPGRPGPASEDRPGEAERRLRDARRRVRRSLLTAFGAPTVLGLVLALVYYPLATAGAVLDRAGYERLQVGDRRDGLGLPRRQAAPPTADDPGGCEYYTDGNFPFAEPTWRLCFSDGRLVSKERIAR
ncbi:sensor histidine kinase [Micromonospora viridifaciens]|uniref:sensor histidine kinase n=1 Tax=Micromonospora viridifaciens TaxID=1881 RepID=UPI001E5F6A42|nr:histidine kinase [Micromonospora viridifaciens]